MPDKNQNFAIAMALVTVGLALTVVMDTWFVGAGFLVIGLQRLYVAYGERTPE